jgi:hypothetical protein
MPNYKLGHHLLVKLTAGRIAEATVKAVIETTKENGKSEFTTLAKQARRRVVGHRFPITRVPLGSGPVAGRCNLGR